ncbi:TIGR01620 family protein [Marinobacterium aestuariivivens]|uniref:TIGR01620 family protein n=1 Tax=Marinobacterium aestuariivivens TaxID=1698799 RepID=A0ABW1ZUR8_9GAMM
MSTEPDNSERDSRRFTPESQARSAEGADTPRQARRFVPQPDDRLEAVPEPVTAAESLPGLEQYSRLRLERLPVRGLGTLGAGLLLLVTVVAVAELISLFDAALSLHWLVATLFAALIGSVALLALRALLSFFRARRSLDQLGRLRGRAEQLGGRHTTGRSRALLEQLKGFYSAKPQAPLLDRALETLPDYSDDSEILRHLEQHFLQPLDREAMKQISGYSAQTGLAVAVSPWAALDMLLALWRSLRMVDDIAQIYGVAPSWPSRLRLIRKILTQLTLVGASELAIDQMTEDLGSTALAGALSARAGQGLGAGILSARIGLAAMQVLRPLPFGEDQAPGIRSLLRPLIEKLKTRLGRRKD